MTDFQMAIEVIKEIKAEMVNQLSEYKLIDGLSDDDLPSIIQGMALSLKALDTALVALGEAQKRHEGCYACRAEQPCFDDFGWWAVYEGDILRLSANGEEHCVASPFCFNCGRPLAREAKTNG